MKMTPSLRPLALATALGAALVTPAFAATEPGMAVAWNQPGSEWQTFDTEHFHLHFLQQHEAQARRAATIAEQAWSTLTVRLGWQPAGRIHMVLTDDHDMANGWAHVEPFNQIRVFLSPPDGHSTLEQYDDWLHLLITHELTHVIHTDMVHGLPALVRKVFGRNPFTFPHAYTPGFLIEGLAVYEETNDAAAYGRGVSTLYDSMMRMEVLNGVDDLSQAVAPLRDLPLGKHYLYGYYYWKFLAETYGDDKIRDYLRNYSGNIIPFFLQNYEARQVFGKSHEALWADFRTWLQQRFAPDIAQLQQQAETPLITRSAVAAGVDPVASDGEHYYYLRDNGQDRRALIKLAPASGQTTELLSLTGMISMDVNRAGDVVYSRYISDASGRVWSDLFRLHNGSEQRLTEGERYRAVCWRTVAGGQQQLLAKRISGGISRLDLLNERGQLIRTLWQGSVDDVLGDFTVSHDGLQLVAAIKRAQQGWNLERMLLNNNQGGEWQALTSTRALENSPRFSRDDQHLLFSADYPAQADDVPVFNLYRLDLSSGQVTQLSHTMGALIQPLEAGGVLFAQAYGAGGYRHVSLTASDENQFALSSQQGRYDYPDAYAQPVTPSASRAYNPLSSMLPTQWLPVWEGTESYNNLGVMIAGGDALGRHSYEITLSRDTLNDISAFNIDYRYDNRWQALLSRENRYNENDNGDLQGIRRHDIAEIARTNLLNGLENKLSLSAGLNRDEEKSLTLDGLSESLPGSRKEVAGLRLDYDSREAYNQSISVSWGTQATLLWETNEGLNSDYSGDIINASVSHFIDLPGNSVLAAHVSGAYGFEQPDPFELGGADSNNGESLFGRSRWALRGYADDTQRGSRIQVNSLEYRTPLLNIERNWNLLPVGLGTVNATIFTDYGAAWSDGEKARYLSSAGVEILTELVVFYGMPLPLRTGYAYAFDNHSDRIYASIGYQF